MALLGQGAIHAAVFLVSNIEEYNQAAANLNPGDTIILRNGVWNDFVIRLAAEGTADAPVSLLAQEPGKVIITGESALLLSGSYLYVDGLSFINGSTPEEAVISFRNAVRGKVASHSRVTNCVVDNFGLKDRWKSDNYVALWGKHNRVDHNYFGDKKNLGVTLVVYLRGEENWPNHHVIDYNHFGPRERLGSNGGETIRFGVSETSLNASFTVLENNLFEHCNGETEIVSIKSSDNIIRNNLFFESEGSLVLRHGNRNQVEGNVFIGNFKPYTGGIRLVNYGHKITGNLLVGLTGDGFRAPLSIMCGLENSPLNRYEPVRDVLIDGNIWMACSNGWDIGVPFTRRDTEGDFVLPTDVTVSNNIVWQNHDLPLVNYITGKARLNWVNNITNASFQSVEFSRDGFSLEQISNITLPNADNNSDEASLGIIKDVFGSVSANRFGPAYKSVKGESLMSKTILVAPGKNALANAVHLAADHESSTLILIDGANYEVNSTIALTGGLKVVSSSWMAGQRMHPALMNEYERFNMPNILPASNFQGDALFSVAGMSDVEFSGVSMRGSHIDARQSVRYGFITDADNSFGDYRFSLNGIVAREFTQSNGAFFKGLAQSFARTGKVNHSLFDNVTGAFVFDEETDDEGRYNIEELHISNSRFQNSSGALVHLYRGGMDESTFGPFLFIDNSEFINNSATGTQEVLNLTGVQVVRIRNSHFQNNGNYIKLMNLKGAKNSISQSTVDKQDRITTENNAVIRGLTINNRKNNQTRRTGVVGFAM